MTREAALEKLLSPIEWDWSSSIGARKRLVTDRHSKVRTAYPFLTEEEREKAREWFKREAHSGLWD